MVLTACYNVQNPVPLFLSKSSSFSFSSLSLSLLSSLIQLASRKGREEGERV